MIAVVTASQLDLFIPNPVHFIKEPKCNGNHIGFMSGAHVPSGLFCSNCNMIVMRLLPPLKNEPEILGYVSATWAWKYEDGRDWTDDIEDDKEQAA
jgi:hypothetical protein